MDTTITARVAEIEQILRAAEAEGIDPAGVTVNQWQLGNVTVHLTPTDDVTPETAVRFLARLTDSTPSASPNGYRSIRAAGYTVFAKEVAR